MAWVETYRLEYYDLQGVYWLAQFNTQDFAGTVTQLEGTEETIRFEYLNESDDVFDPIKPTKAVMSVINGTNFSFESLFSADDMQVQVKIYQGAEDAAHLHWLGWVDPREYEEPYDIVPNIVQISCIDGLSLLSEMLYAEEDSELNTEYYNGRKTPSQILLDILGKIGYTEFKEFINIYEYRMSNSVNDSPLDQKKIDVDVFTDMFCDDVLRELFKKWNACIRQVSGIFCIYRPKEIVETTVYGRYFTEADVKTSVSFTADQFINRAAHNTIFKQVSSGNKMYLSPIKKLKLLLDYGNKDSWIDAWQFKATEYNDVGVGSFDYWTNNGNLDVRHISEFLKDEEFGVAFRATDLSAASMSQVFGANIKASAGDRIVIEFDYNWFNNSAAPTGATAIAVLVTQSSDNLVEKDDTFAEWGSGYLLEITPNDVYGGSNIPTGFGDGWISFKREFDGILNDGSITIAFAPQVYVDIYNCYRNVRIYATSTEIQQKIGKRSFWQRITGGYGGEYQLKKKYYKITYKEPVKNYVEQVLTFINNINGNDVNVEWLVGDIEPTLNNIDNILEQFKGALAIITRSTLAEAATAFDTNHDADYVNQDITHSSNVLNFTGNDDTDFIGASSIVNTSGDLSGSVVTGTPFSPGTAQINRIVFSSSGSSGQGNITIGGITNPITYLSTIEQAIDDWISNYGGGYPAFTLTRVGTDILEIEGATGYLFSSSYVETTPDLLGYAYVYQAGSALVNRVDTITLSGTNGTADITVDGVTEEVSITEVLVPSEVWSTRDEDSSGGQKSLMQFMGDETANQYSKFIELIDMPIQETGGSSVLNLIGNLQDDLKKVGGENIRFVANRGTFYTRSRKWRLDLVEIVR